MTELEYCIAAFRAGDLMAACGVADALMDEGSPIADFFATGAKILTSSTSVVEVAQVHVLLMDILNQEFPCPNRND